MRLGHIGGARLDSERTAEAQVVGLVDHQQLSSLGREADAEHPERSEGQRAMA